MIGAQYTDNIDMKPYNEFVTKFKQFSDFPEIATASSSDDFFQDNLSSSYFQWTEIKDSGDKNSYVNK